MKIVTVPNPVLKQISEPVERVDKKLVKFVQELEETLVTKKNPEGVGLSAIQVGKPLRVFSLYLDRDNPQNAFSLINPVITSASKKMSLGGREDKPFLEGCLSIENTFGPVWRHQRITLEFYTLDETKTQLVKQKKKYESFPARVVQHEMDHLDGILFTERSLEQGLPIYREERGELVEIK